MKLYIYHGTNPRVVELFLAQKGIEIEKVWIDIAKGDNRSEEFLKKNCLGQLPVLELDSGQCISQITAICEYLEELHPTPSMLGSSPELRAETRMWMRRIDLLIAEPIVSAYRNSEGLPYFQSLIHSIPHAASDLKEIAKKNILWMDQQLENRKFVCGERFSLADIQLFCFLDFANNYGQPLDKSNCYLINWIERVTQQLNLP